MALYSRESLENLRNKVDIVDVVSQHIEVKKQGAVYKALCPFHDEKTPSFILDKSDGHYHCFGCGAHGDAIQFLLEHQRLSFTEAVERLAERYHVALVAIEKEDVTEAENKARLREVLESACQYFEFMLVHTEEGRKAALYLQERGLTVKFIKKFRLGLSINEPKLFQNYMNKRGFSGDLLEEAGLLSKAPARREFFFDRITFPIHHPSGYVIGFSARKFKEGTFGGKYINSPETKLFKKSKLLFGLNYSRRRIAKERKALIVEGQIDALRLIDEGFDFAVASQGTAFGEEHAKELQRLGVVTVYLSFDGDDAGGEAATKVGDLFLKMGVEVKVVSLEKGEDPDSFMRKWGRDAFAKKLEDAEDYLDFLFRRMAKGADLSSPAVKKRVVDEIASMINKWESEIIIHESLKKLSFLAKLPENLITRQIEKKPVLLHQRTSLAGVAKIDPHFILESDFIRWLLLLMPKGPTHLSIAAQNITQDHFNTPLCRQLYQKIHEMSSQGTMNLLKFSTSLQNGELEALLQEILSKSGDPSRAEPSFFEAMQKLLDRSWMDRRESIRVKIQSGHLSEEEAFRLLKEFEEVKRQEPKIRYLDGSEKRYKN
ncbi:DNA primase [Estrella lausannensis]|uniref:DNA primase n=1 Tax=Estrella lausannensis TaxID=483423 RepID=A0A0H5DU62_9BACT|nr:DNA primase [Estrella lausannensis]CRX39454.1 DNA primase [Estrella lausannensis]